VSLAFPKTLFATSIRGVTSTVSALVCASAVGSWIDRAPTRLPPLLITISSNHGAVIAGYLCWLIWPLMAGYEGDSTAQTQTPFSSLSKGFLFGFILLLDVLQHLSALGNKLSVERDWVPVLVGEVTSDTTYGLTQINAVLGRIDLICKLVAPSLLPLIVSNFNSRAAWIILLIVVTAIMWVLELWCAHIIAKDNPQLRLPKAPSHDEATMEDLEIDERYHNIKPGLTTLPQKLYFVFYQDPRVRFKHYFSMAVWPASISISILQMTVLAYSATLITYLLEVGFSLSAVTIARASGSLLGLSATFITPVAVTYLKRQYSRGQRKQDSEIESRVVRTVGLWGILSQFLCMVSLSQFHK
jgi:iron-regulated transporter 1